MKKAIKKTKDNKSVVRSILLESPARYSRGMTYVELIVVLSIFSVMTSVVIFNYSGFQAKVDIKNLATDIALKLVEAQKSSLSGNFPVQAVSSSWKPSYGIFIDLDLGNKSLIYFTDLNNNNLFDDSDCNGECIEKMSITKGNSISSLDVFFRSDPLTPVPVSNLTTTFTRPNSGAFFHTTDFSLSIPDVSFVQVVISSPQGSSAKIKVYPSGRIQVN